MEQDDHPTVSSAVVRDRLSWAGARIRDARERAAGSRRPRNRLKRGTFVEIALEEQVRRYQELVKRAADLRSYL